MIHFKSKSSKIKEESNKEDEQTNSNNEYVSTTVNQIDSTKDNLSLNLMTEENIGKISSLFSDPDYNDKVINISRLDESLCYTDKNTKKEKIENKNNIKNENNESDYGLMIKDIINGNNNENNISNPVINISYLENQNNDDKKSDYSSQINNSNINIQRQNTENISNIEKKDEAFKYKKTNKFCNKKRFIFILVKFIILFSLFSFLYIFLKYTYY